jgi:hypothetical protein
MWMQKMLMAWLVVCLAGCEIRDCDWAQPIRPSRADHLTEGTQRQILGHNATGAKLCGWQP